MALQREAVVQAAEKLVARGKIEAAIREYRKVLSEHPNDANTLNRVGDLYARLERFDEAVRFFAQIAENYTHDGFFVKAIAIYKKIIKLDPTRLDVYERLAALYHRQGLVNEARSQYQVLADYYQKHDNPASALSMYERMAELEPDNPTHHVKLAELYQQQHLTEKAMGAYRTIAELMVGHGHSEEAAQVYERALDVHAGDLHFIREAVERLRAAGAEAGAARVLAVATRKNPEARHLAQDLMAPTSAAPPPVPPPALAEPEPPPPAAQPAVPAQVPPPGWEEADTGPVIAAASAPPLDEFAVDLDAVAEEAAALSLPGPAAPTSGDEIELDLDEVFVLDFEEEEAPASLVRPPPDMADGRPAEAFRRSAGEPAGSAYEALPTPAVPGAFEAMPPELEEVVFTWDEDEVPSAAAVAPPAVPAEIDHDFLEKTAAELQPTRLRHDDDLLTEAEVLAKYGLADKATDRLLELLEGTPLHPEGLALLLRLDLEGGRHERAAATAATLFTVAEERGDHELWQRQRDRLEAAGYRFEGAQVVAGPGIAAEPEPVVAPPPEASAAAPARVEPTPAEPTRAQPDAAPPAPVRRRAGVTAGAVDAQLAQLAAEVLAVPKRKPQPVAPPSATPVAAAASPAPPPPPPAPSPPAPPPAAADEPEESGMSWLDEVESAAPAAGAAAEDEFFDLAAELEQELLAAEAAADVEEDMLAAPREQSLEEIVEGFKRGVEENLSPEDYDTHFNLGIAYREMGLLDEAIGEFQLAAKDSARLVECCSMLGLCFLDKGLPELSIKWYKRGLSVRGLREDDMLGLLYDLGNVYFTIGDLDSAHATFVEVYGTNSNYRDVAARLEQIAAHRR